jgi:hypothetical protein
VADNEGSDPNGIRTPVTLGEKNWNNQPPQEPFRVPQPLCGGLARLPPKSSLGRFPKRKRVFLEGCSDFYLAILF